MGTQEYWQQIHQARSANEKSWYSPHLELSLEWVCDAAHDRATPILDVGAGESTLVDDLLARGYGDVTALDISPAVLERVKARLGADADKVRWLVGDVITAALPGELGVWHDRAVFHFLVEPEQRRSYVQQAISALRSGGHAIMATFGPQGPERCSGLPTMRYDAESLARELGSQFRLAKSALVQHRTPAGVAQQFLYCDFVRS